MKYLKYGMTGKLNLISPVSCSLLFSFLLFLLLISGCKAKKKIAAVPAMTKKSSEFLNEKIKANEIDAQWVIARARIQISDSKSNNSFTANIRLRKDSVMWVSISPMLGIEVARMLITTDSVKVIDKMNRKTIVRDFSFINSMVPYPVDFAILQKIFLGNMIFYNDSNLSAGIMDTTCILISETDKVKNTIAFNTLFQVITSLLQDKTQPYTMKVNLDDYRLVGEKMFSFKRRVEIVKGEKTMLSIDFEKVRFNEPVDFPFTIKEKYPE